MHRPLFGMRFRRLVIGLGALLVAFYGHGQSEEERALSAVRADIEALEARLAEQIEQRGDSEQALKSVEVEIAEANTRLAALRRDARAESERLEDLSAQARRAGDRLGAERAALAHQVRMSYVAGRQEFVKMLLSQETPASLGRMMVYYDYFNRARSESIATLGAELGTLADLMGRSRSAEAELARLETAEAREVERLDSVRGERRSMLARIDSQIAEAGDEIGKLKREEERLNDLVLELGELLSGLPRDAETPFAEVRGRLPWPVQGRVANAFGSPRSGGPLRWRGVMLEAEGGATVRAVYHGRVAFADWLPGLGLLIIVDHGDGFMSLYGHNAALLGEPGDWVGPGEAIAEVGDSGGQQSPALYFEIRRNGEPVDPADWIAPSR